jgi:hypothetical protein
MRRMLRRENTDHDGEQHRRQLHKLPRWSLFKSRDGRVPSMWFRQEQPPRRSDLHSVRTGNVPKKQYGGIGKRREQYVPSMRGRSLQCSPEIGV